MSAALLQGDFGKNRVEEVTRNPDQQNRKMYQSGNFANDASLNQDSRKSIQKLWKHFTETSDSDLLLELKRRQIPRGCIFWETFTSEQTLLVIHSLILLRTK